MKYYSDIFKIFIRGSKENIVRMLNAAIRNLESDNFIADGDDLETINDKVGQKNNHYGLRLALLDLLDEDCLQDSVILEQKLEYERHVERRNADMGAEKECDGRYIDVLQVEEMDEGYEIKLEAFLGEESAYFTWPDWADWADISRLYQCRILIDDIEYLNTYFYRFCGARIFVPDGNSVTETKIEPEVGSSNFDEEFDKLIEINPERYSQIKSLCLEFS